MRDIVKVSFTASDDAERQKWADDVSIVMARVAGGFTQYHATGGWVMEDGSLAKEPVIFCECVCQDANAVWSAIMPTVAAYRAACQQEAVMVGINGEVTFWYASDFEAA